MGNSRAGGNEPEELEELVKRLLGRAQNAFELDDAVVERLGAALMHHTEMASCRQHNGPPRVLGRRTLRHTFLLGDGGSLVLYEVEHNTGEDDELLYEVYAEPEAMAHAQRVIDYRFGESTPEDLDTEATEWAARLPHPPEMPPMRRSYDEDHSAEHAWRVLRRAENVDTWPEAEIRQRLIMARAHHISYVTNRCSRIDSRVVGWTLYEHAFLLADGEEVSLWEVEHTMTPDGRPVCEVYEGEAAACDAADLRLEAP
jgi:hypothetical protein